MRWLILIFLTASAISAEAAPFVFEKNGERWQMPMPPDYWFARPLLAPVSLVPMPQKEVEEQCSAATGKHEDMGCAWVNAPYVCTIAIANELEPETWVAVYRHELAHCHGWPADHPMD